MKGRGAIGAVLAAAVPGVALAHAYEGPPLGNPGWSLEPWVVVPMLLAAALFGAGWLRLKRRSGLGADRLNRQGLLFAIGLVVLAGAVISPLHQAGRQSFTAHMIEHELMMLAAAPLLVLARPLAVMLWAFPAAGRRALGAASKARPVALVWRGLTDPGVATLLQAAALWLWHAPALFDRALTSEAWHIAQHVSFLATALLFWSAALDRKRGVGQAALCLFATSLISGALGAFMALSQSPWYEAYVAMGMTPFGLTPAEDQQLAGVLMWVPGGLVHAVAALVLIAPVLRAQPGGRHAHRA